LEPKKCKNRKPTTPTEKKNKKKRYTTAEDVYGESSVTSPKKKIDGGLIWKEESLSRRPEAKLKKKQHKKKGTPRGERERKELE